MKIIVGDNEWNKVKDALAYAYSRGQEQLKVLYKNMVIYIKTFYVLM
jgi:hypothetical protein